MRIGIVTVHSAYNYGAMLQAIATQRIMTEMGHQIQFIDFYPRTLEKINNNTKIALSPRKIALSLFLLVNQRQRLKLKRFAAFRNQLNLTQRYYTKDEIYKKPPEFDIYMVGSDQVWNMENGISPFNFLDFVKEKNCKKISYASSFGTSKIPGQYHKKLKELLDDFSAISVREDDGVEIIEKATGKKAVQVLDPTLLLPKENWEDFIPQKNQTGHNYILIYALNNTEESVKLLEAIRKRYNLPVIGIPMGFQVPKKFRVDKEVKDAGPLEFVSLIQHAKVICTSSFHGLAFAINFEKTFFVVPHQTRNSRLNSMLKALELEKRQLYTPDKIENMTDPELFMDFTETRSILNNLRNNSLEFLEKNTRN